MELSAFCHIRKQRVVEDECVAYFQFEKKDLPRLLRALKTPNMVVCPNETVANGMEALCITLRRLDYPCKLGDIIPLFGRSAPVFSLICSEIVDHIHNAFGGLLSRIFSFQGGRALAL